MVDFCSHQFVDQEALNVPVFDEKKDEEKEVEEEEEELGELYIVQLLNTSQAIFIQCTAVAVVVMIVWKPTLTAELVSCVND